MAREKLTTVHLRTKRVGVHADGAGLYLQVKESRDPHAKAGAVSRSWLFRYKRDGRERWMGMGSAADVGLADARERARQARLVLDAGGDPISAREAERQEKKIALAKSKTLSQIIGEYIASHRAGWRNSKHAAQWSTTLATYVAPMIGDRPIASIDVQAVVDVLTPMWATKTETASRVRQRLEAVLDYAKALGIREGENPARWDGALAELLPKKTKVAKVENHAAIDYRLIAPFMALLRQRPGTAARALEFLILTAARTGEVLGARFSEIEQDEKIWRVPAERMKAGKEHRVALCDRAVDIIEEQRKAGATDFIFPGATGDAPLSNMALLMLLRRMGRTDITAHGMRAAFKTWAAEQTTFPNELVEMALAHTLPSKVEAAYLRATMVERRRQLMAAWQSWCARLPDATGKVLNLRRAG